MIDEKHIPQIKARASLINSKPIPTDTRNVLLAVVYAMADEFSDLLFSSIPTAHTDAKALEFFCSCVRHHWAHLTQGAELSACSYTDVAINAPFSDGELISLVMRFEAKFGVIWNPNDAKARKAS